jgi:hypothetical protein
LPQSCLTITGNSSVSISSLGSSAKAGDVKIVSFNGANTLVYNSTSLILPGAANITTTSATVCLFEYLGSGDWLAQNCGSGSGGGGSGVSSFNGRTGAVLPASNDYSFSQINGTIAYNQLITPLQSGTADYIPYWMSSSVLANGSPTLIASQVLPAISPPGASINVSGTLGSPNTSVTIAADGFVVCSALTSANCTELGSYSQTFQGSTTGAGGMDTGSLPTAGTVAFYAIYNPTAPSTSILGCSTGESGCGGTVYTAAHLPSGYSQTGLLGKWATNSTPNLIAGTATSTAPFNVIASAIPSAPIGAIINGSTNLASAGASITYAADEVVVGTALNGTAYVLSSFSQTFNGGTTGAGGMDTGNLPSSGYVCIYAIYNPASPTTTSILGVNCSTSSGTIYSGAHMPSGYTASALVATWPTNSTPNMVAGYVRGRTFQYSTPVVVLSASQTNHASPTSLSVSAGVPPNATQAVFAPLELSANSSVAATAGFISIGPDNTTAQSIYYSSAIVASDAINYFSPGGVVLMPTTQTVYYTSGGLGTNLTLTASVSSYSW